jgi:restriction endonuclease S subunit
MSESDISSYIVDILESKSSHSVSLTDRAFKILDDIVCIIRGMPAADSQLYNEPKDTRLPYIVSSDIVDRKINCEKAKYLEPAENPTVDQYIIKANDILISIRGIAGKLALVNKELGDVIASSQIAILRIKTEQVSPEYLYYVLSSTYTQQQLAEYKVGKNISGLSPKDLRKVRIPVPSLLQQYEIVKRIKITETKEREIKQSTEPLGSSLEEFIKRGESDTLEFKSTMRKPTRLPQSILTKEQDKKRKG